MFVKQEHTKLNTHREKNQNKEIVIKFYIKKRCYNRCRNLVV